MKLKYKAHQGHISQRSITAIQILLLACACVLQGGILDKPQTCRFNPGEQSHQWKLKHVLEICLRQARTIRIEKNRNQN